MATFTFAPGTHRWTDGTTVWAIPYAAMPGLNAPPYAGSGFVYFAKMSANTASTAVATAGTVAFTGLADGTSYYAVGGSPPTVQFSTPPTADVETVAQSLWTAPGVIAETTPLYLNPGIDAGSLTSGTLMVFGGAVLPAGSTSSAISFHSGGVAAVSPTNQWFCLVDQNRNVLAKTVDDTTTAWASNSKKTLALSAPYFAAATTPVYIGIVVAAATPPTLRGWQTVNQFAQNTPQPPNPLGAFSTSGLTTPASLGATAAALLGSAFKAYAWVT